MGYNGSLHGTASGAKALLIAKSLVEKNVNVTILSKAWKSNTNKFFSNLDIIKDGVHLISAGEKFSRPSNFIKRNLLKTIIIFNEIYLLWHCNNSEPITAVILVSRSFTSIIFYWFLSWILKLLNKQSVLELSYFG